MDRCVEVVARFGETVLAVAHVPLDATYRVGTAADVDITVPGLGSFPILEGGQVRRPVGCVARGLAGTEARLAPGIRVELEFGSVVIVIAVVPLVRAVMPKPRFELRPFVYGAAVLAVHLALWALAMTRAPGASPGRHARIAQIKRRTAEHEPAPPPPTVVAEVAHPPRPGGAAAERARRHAPQGIAAAAAETFATHPALFDTTALENGFDDKAGIYNEDEANAHGFGGANGHFDPTVDPAFATIPVGHYATNAHAGDDYDLGRPPTVVTMCESSDCIASGVDTYAVRALLEQHHDGFLSCWREKAAREAGEVVLELTIAANRVREATGTGLGDTGPCIARIARKLVIPASSATVRMSIAFR